MRIRAIDKRLIGEIELRRPVQHGAARQLGPIAGSRHRVIGIAIALRDDFARNIDEMFLVDRSSADRPSASDPGDIVIGLAEPRIGIQRIGILAQEIIVSFVVEAVIGIGIDINAGLKRFAAAHDGIEILPARLTNDCLSETIAVVGSALIAELIFADRIHRQRIDEDVVIFFGFIMEIVAADAEIDGPLKFEASRNSWLNCQACSSDRSCATSRSEQPSCGSQNIVAPGMEGSGRNTRRRVYANALGIVNTPGVVSKRL